MAIKIRRGLDADRLSVVFEEGEVLYTTDTKSFFIGDGVTAGGNQIGGTTAAELLKTEVHNATGATLTSGQVVYLSGNTGNKPNAVLAKADDEATSSKTIGLIILNIANNANGDIATDGLLSDINTSAFAPGDLLWLSDSVAGGVTTVAPDTPNNAVFIGYVVAAHPTQGKILIHIQNGYELNELHDVKITSVANGDGLIYDSTLGYWKNSAEFTTQGNTFNAANKLVQLDGTAKLPAVDGSQLTNLPSFTPPNGLLKIASAISTTFQAVTDYLGNASVLFLNSRRVGIGKDTSVTTQSVAVVEVQDANTSIVLKPNGTGAIIASVPDGTATGGNARGANAVDLSMYRVSNSAVASGVNSVISGGAQNTASGTNSSVIGGTYNQATGQWSISGGSLNQATGSYSISIGGSNNTASSSYSTISGGQSNTASTNTHATVVGGQSNTSSGQFAISGGYNTVSSGGGGSVAFGYQSQAQNTYSIALGYQATASGAHSFAAVWGANASGNSSIALGNLASASGINSIAVNRGVAGGQNSLAQGFTSQTSTLNSSAFGLGSYTSLDAQQSLGQNISYKGDSQTSRVTYPINTGSVSSGGTYTFTGSQLIVPKNGTYGSGVTQAYLCTAKFIYGARNKSGTVTTINNKDCFTAIYNFAAKSTNNTGALIGTPTLQISFSDTNLSTTSISITIGASGEILFSFTPPTWIGGGTIEFRGTLHLEFTEIGLF